MIHDPSTKTAALKCWIVEIPLYIMSYSVPPSTCAAVILIVSSLRCIKCILICTHMKRVGFFLEREFLSYSYLILVGVCGLPSFVTVFKMRINCLNFRVS